MRRKTLTLIKTLLLLVLLSFVVNAQQVSNRVQSVIVEGIEIVFEPIHVDKEKPGGLFTQGDDVRFRFTVRDTVANKPLSRLFPAAWLDKEVEAIPCTKRISAFLGGNLFTRAELDLNAYYVLTLNDDPTISVVDPLFGFGGSKLLALINLKSPGYDWRVSDDQQSVYVSTPATENISVINAANWKVAKDLKISAKPYNLLLQNDEKYLWATYRSDGAESLSGVAAISTGTNQLMKKIDTGRGDHQMALSDDNKYLFVTNSLDQNVSIIDVATLTKLKDIKLGGSRFSMAWSTKARSVYIADGEKGIVHILDGKTLKATGQIKVRPGVIQLRFDPTGRLAFLVNTEQSIVQIIDSARNRVVQTGETESQPDQVSFSDELAYVRHRNSEIVLMFPLDQLGREGARLPVVDFPGGQEPPGKMNNPTPASGIVRAPGASAVLVSNPGDKSVYFSKEGMAAPMGTFSNYGRSPRAVEVVDKSLKEKGNGIYETVGRLGGNGNYVLGFFMDAPRVAHCFSMKIAAAASDEKQVGLGIEYLNKGMKLTVGQTFPLRFKLTDRQTNKPKEGLKDVQVVTFQAPGNWQQRNLAKSLGGGEYEVAVNVPVSGIYYVYVGSHSMGVSFRDLPPLILQAK